jgi:hypothetical protein
LARAVGGLELCGNAVWENREHPVYGAARVIQGWHAELVARPREDLPGSMPCAAFTSTRAKRQVWLQIESENRQTLGSP